MAGEPSPSRYTYRLVPLVLWSPMNPKTLAPPIVGPKAETYRAGVFFFGRWATHNFSMLVSSRAAALATLSSWGRATSDSMDGDLQPCSSRFFFAGFVCFVAGFLALQVATGSISCSCIISLKRRFVCFLTTNEHNQGRGTQQPLYSQTSLVVLVPKSGRSL